MTARPHRYRRPGASSMTLTTVVNRRAHVKAGTSLITLRRALLQCDKKLLLGFGKGFVQHHLGYVGKLMYRKPMRCDE